MVYCWITGQNVQRLQIFAILALFLYSNLKTGIPLRCTITSSCWEHTPSIQLFLPLPRTVWPGHTGIPLSHAWLHHWYLQKHLTQFLFSSCTQSLIARSLSYSPLRLMYILADLSQIESNHISTNLDINMVRTRHIYMNVVRSGLTSGNLNEQIECFLWSNLPGYSAWFKCYKNMVETWENSDRTPKVLAFHALWFLLLLPSYFGVNLSAWLDSSYMKCTNSPCKYYSTSDAAELTPCLSQDIASITGKQR